MMGSPQIPDRDWSGIGSYAADRSDVTGQFAGDMADDGENPVFRSEIVLSIHMVDSHFGEEQNIW
jgi:hypothetical protein